MQSKTYAFVAMVWLGCAGLAFAQQGSSDSGYQGVSRPPTDTIQTTPDDPPVIAKPSPSVLAAPTSSYTRPAQAPVQVAPVQDDSGPVVVQGGQDGYQPVSGQRQHLDTRPSDYNPANDPDGDIVHPRSSRPGELMSGATIRVRLIDRISSSQSEKGEPFRGQVASDVMEDGKVLIPAGSSIEGRVSAVSGGHFGGHGSFRLRPEAVILPDGSRFQLHAEVTGTPGSKTRMGAEGSINAGSRAKKDGIEYGAVVGTGAVTGAVLGGPVGALTGTLIGAGIVTTHLMVDHPQAVLEPGSVLLFTLTEPMDLMPATN